MDYTDVVKFLKEKVELFQGFDRSELEDLVGRSRITTFEAEEAIIEFGEESRFLGVLLQGRAEVSVTDNAGDKHTVQVLESGNLFGVPSLMTGNRTIDDVIGLERCTALLVPLATAKSIITANPAAVTVLSRVLVERMQRLSDHDGDNLARNAFERSEDPFGFKLQTDEPMKILVVNCGSSSLKYNLFDTMDETRSVRGSVERIGEDETLHTYHSPSGTETRDLPTGTHEEAFQAMIDVLTGAGGVLASTIEVSAVGHRVAHGGDRYHDAVVIDDGVIETIEAFSELAPLHNPVHLAGIRYAQKLFPHVEHVAVFDTAFHQTIPAYAHLYGLPWEYYEEKKIRRYGFHGTSHKYVALKTAEFLKRPFNELETIVCHLGNGASLCGVDHGRSVDTTMGFTPVEGLIMGSRCGDLDAGIIEHLMRTEGLDHRGLGELINKKGGLLGLSGVSNDVREIRDAADGGDHRALLALKVFAYRVRKYIGSYVAAMGGLDALAFTGGIGQGSVGIRSLACQGLGQVGILIDENKNREADGFNQISDISAEGSRVRILVVPTDEERMIARETLRALERNQTTKIIRRRTPTPVPIEISAHHVHLSPEHVQVLFGPNHELTPFKELSQPGQYACVERVNLIGPKGTVENVRILGPTRKETQVEISMTEQYALGIHPPIRESGVLKGTPGVTLEGPGGRLTIEQGVICALRHIHMSTEEALGMGLKDKDVVRVRVPGDRELIFGDVLVRVNPNYRLAMHIDTDEGNAANLTTGVEGYIDGIQSRRG